jgi:hypothetical protein
VRKHSLVALAFLLAAHTAHAQQPPVCTQAHPCHHVLHVGPSTSRTAHVSWDSKQLFAAPQIAIVVRYKPKRRYDAPLQAQPIGDCGLHFVVFARFTGFASRCGDGLLPLHVQVANVTTRRLRVRITYWVPAPTFTG